MEQHQDEENKVLYGNISLFYVNIHEVKKGCHIKLSRRLWGDKMSVSLPPPAEPEVTQHRQAQVQGPEGRR